MTEPPPPSLKRVVYTSVEAGPLVRGDLGDILRASRTNNARLGITGLLVYFEDCFLQCLEGEGSAVAATLARVAADPRHHNVTVLLDEPAAARAFEHWGMGYVELGSHAWAQLLRAPWTRQEIARTGHKPGIGVLRDLATAAALQAVGEATGPRPLGDRVPHAVPHRHRTRPLDVATVALLVLAIGFFLVHGSP